MNHKRRKPKSKRAGCLMCKPQKRQGSKLTDREKMSVRRRIIAAEGTKEA